MLLIIRDIQYVYQLISWDLDKYQFLLIASRKKSQFKKKKKKSIFVYWKGINQSILKLKYYSHNK